MLPSVILVVTAVAILLGRVWVPWARAPRGTLVRRVRLALLGRLRFHGAPVVAVLTVAVPGWALGLVPPAPLALTGIAIAALIALPVRYTLTTEGIALGRTPFRRWTEFGGVMRRRGGVRLQGVAGARGMTVWLSGSRDDDEFVLLLRQLVRGSYKGEVWPIAETENPESAPDAARVRSLERARAGG